MPDKDGLTTGEERQKMRAAERAERRARREQAARDPKIQQRVALVGKKVTVDGKPGVVRHVRPGGQVLVETEAGTAVVALADVQGPGAGAPKARSTAKDASAEA